LWALSNAKVMGSFIFFLIFYTSEQQNKPFYFPSGNKWECSVKVKMHMEVMCKVATNIQGKLKFEVIKMTFTWGHVHRFALTSK
jgi:hypothetical protein